MIAGSDPSLVQASLRRCNHSFKTTINATEYHTPGSSIVKTNVCETPKSGHGSSIFSPGEAFWKEAIQVADGLFAQADNVPSQAGEIVHIKSPNEIDKSKDMLDERQSKVKHVGTAGSLYSMAKHGQNSNVEASPLPVKHLDFLSEDRDFEGSTPRHGAEGSLELMKHRGSGALERGAVNHKGPRTTEFISHPCKSASTREMTLLHERTSVSMVREKRDLVSSVYSIRSESPGNDIKKSIANKESDGASTPSSSAVVDVRLDLSSWLPSEICSIYRKRGISKLYPWQVVTNF